MPIPPLSSRRNPVAALALSMSLLLTVLTSPGARAEQVNLVGLNLSGAGFAGQVLPGVNGTHYIFPVEAYFSQWSARGIKLVRFPVLWERLQPQLNAPFDATYAALIDRTFGYAQKYGIKIIFDLHNYMRYRGDVIGTAAVPYSSYKDVMSRIARRWSSHPALYAYDIMNEPHDAMTQWPIAAQQAIDAVRAIDTVHPIMIEGNGWAEATRWPQWNDALLGLSDPANNLIFQAHVYFDGEGGGGAYTSTSAAARGDDYGVERVRPFVEWLKRNGKRGMIGEFGIPDNDARWNVIMGRMLAYLKQNCIPATYWAAGPGWGNYNLSVEPINGVERPQWATLKAYLDDSSCSAIGPRSNSTTATESTASARNQAATEAVTSVYQDYLDRSVDKAGLDYWSSHIANGNLTLAQLINSVMGSAEYQNRSAIEGLYRTYLGRNASGAEVSYWANLVNGGGSTIENIRNAFVHSAEYSTNVANSVEQLYRGYLGRSADSASLGYWTQQIVGGSLTAAQVKSAITQSEEYRSVAQAEIGQLYRTYLGREPDTAGLSGWTNQLTSGNLSLGDIEQAISNSAESRARR